MTDWRILASALEHRFASLGWRIGENYLGNRTATEPVMGSTVDLTDLAKHLAAECQLGVDKV